MRTTLNLPDGLVEEAQKILQMPSKTEAVSLALRELIRRRRIADLKAMMGKVHLEIDVAASRRRR